MRSASTGRRSPSARSRRSARCSTPRGSARSTSTRSRRSTPAGRRSPRPPSGGCSRRRGSRRTAPTGRHTPTRSRAPCTSCPWTCPGGAAISPAAERGFLEATGKQVHNAYGLTETTSPMTVTPFGSPSPVDPTSGALSVGVPAPNTIVRIQGDDGEDLPLGEVGEIVAEGPQVVAGYWGKPEETAANLPGGALHSGDVGFLDPDGWGDIGSGGA